MEEKIEHSTQKVLVLMAVAYLFSFVIRMYWVYYFHGNASFMWNGEFMINTNDGYFFASMAQKLLENMHQYNPRVLDGWNYAVVLVTVLAAKITPFSLETIILYMPSVISSLVVIPIILIGRLYNNLSVGFFAALVGSIAWSYYNRTMTGYYDTDMFSAMAPMFILYFLLATIEKEKDIYLLLSAVAILVYPFLYDSGLSLVYAMGIFYMGYMLLFHRKEAFTYQSIILISIALMGVYWYIKLPLILAGYFYFKRVELDLKKLVIFSGLAFVLFLITGNVLSLLYAKLITYTVRGTEQSGLMFFQVAQTVREAGQIPFSTMANRISGSTLGVIIAFIGYITLVWKHKPFILALPLIGIGLFSLWGGLRFTVYAVPVAAISAIYFFYLATRLIENKKLQVGALAFLTAVFLYPNINHIVDYKVPTVFNVEEVKVLDRLKKVGSDKDYVIAWWDYGYPLWFYANKNTLIDGGKHNHDNYIVSKIMTSPSQKEAAYLSRIAVETYVDSNYTNIADTLFHNGKADQVNVDNFFDELNADAIELPKATRDVFLYLPYRMMNIFPTVKVFSNLDLQTGLKKNRPFMYQATKFTQEQGKVDLGSGVVFDQKTGMINAGGQDVPIRYIITTGTLPSGKTDVNYQNIHKGAPFVIVILKNYNRVLVLDMEMFNSTFIQMFFLENYDKNLFEAVELSPYAKVYRVKI